jgi:hypothetical protein
VEVVLCIIIVMSIKAPVCPLLHYFCCFQGHSLYRQAEGLVCMLGVFWVNFVIRAVLGVRMQRIISPHLSESRF